MSLIKGKKAATKEGIIMLDKLKEYFKEGLGYTHVAGILQQVANIINIVSVQYMKDGDAKNAAIDMRHVAEPQGKGSSKGKTKCL